MLEMYDIEVASDLTLEVYEDEISVWDYGS
jgi:hypothetical protein